MVIYAAMNKEIKRELEQKLSREIIIKPILSIWDLEILEAIYGDLKNKKSVFVINPAFDFFDIDVFCEFVIQALKGGNNLYFAPQINPDYFIKEPFWFFVSSLDAIGNFLVESLYLKKSIKIDFRNFLHKRLRGHSISRVDIPKYLTNLSENWEGFFSKKFSKDFFLKYSDVYFPHPQNVHIAISNRCNLECVMCPYHAKEYRAIQTSNFFDKNLFMQIQDFKKIAKYCGDNKIFMQFGQLDEPFIHPRFLEFLDIAKDYGVEHINITTNGTLLNKKNAEKIVQSNINHITFSLDAIDKESYKRIRGYDYDTTVANIQYLIDLLKITKKKTTLGVCFILQGENAQEKGIKFLEYWLPLVDKVKFHQLSEFEVDENGSFVTKHQKQFREYKQRYACSIPWQVLFITPDLKVTFCCNSMSVYSTSGLCGGGGIIGDLKMQTLEEVWRGDSLMQLRRELLDNSFQHFKICEKCSLWSGGEPNIEISHIAGLRVKKTYTDSEIIYEKE